MMTTEEKVTAENERHAAHLARIDDREARGVYNATMAARQRQRELERHAIALASLTG